MKVDEIYIKNQYMNGLISKRIAINKLKLFLNYTSSEAESKLQLWES